MSAILTNHDHDNAAGLRSRAGEWLRARRERLGYSQSDLSRALGLEHYTFISQIENGRGRIPPNRYAEWADALEMPRRDFTIQMMKFYDPITYELLFGESA